MRTHFQLVMKNRAHMQAEAFRPRPEGWIEHQSAGDWEMKQAEVTRKIGTPKTLFRVFGGQCWRKGF
jgi:hypothetical protein